MTYIYSPPKHRRSGTTMQKKRGRGELKRWISCREVLSGFPWDGEFKSREQILEYLAHDKITCMLCGKEYKKLGVHITRVHDIDAYDYKLKFNIPQRYGLAGQTTRERMKARMATAEGQKRAAILRIVGKRPKVYVPPRRVCNLVRTLAIENIREYNARRK